MKNPVLESSNHEVILHEKKRFGQRVALLGGMDLLEEVCHCGDELCDLPPSCLEDSLLVSFETRYRTLSSASTAHVPHLDDNGLKL